MSISSSSTGRNGSLRRMVIKVTMFFRYANIVIILQMHTITEVNMIMMTLNSFSLLSFNTTSTRADSIKLCMRPKAITVYTKYRNFLNEDVQVMGLMQPHTDSIESAIRNDAIVNLFPFCTF
ncbi:uncharacterized protein LOC143211534 [Lasioglossum baleicum]|uniref:uncharacterized protein LOC143211534 n=1 Tax=Lasioglossum baleicum TaxID=434251 RepID=UPI003FCEC1E8